MRAFMAVLSVGVLASCNGLSDVTLPGGSATGGKIYHVKIEFNDVLDLVPQASVRVDDVSVGDVEKIKLDGFHALVTVRLKDSVKLPANAHAELRSTSLLGEKFVTLSPPTAPSKPIGRLTNGATILLANTGRNPEFEEVFSALSGLLNGGGVAQVQTISAELSNAFSGRESQVRDVPRQLTDLAGALDDAKQQIVRALDSVDRLARRLADQKGTLAHALDSIPPALKVLADQRTDLTQVLTGLSKLGAVGSRVIRATRDNTVAGLRSLGPILGNLAAAKSNIVKSLELLLNYPFPGSAYSGVHGDYAGLYASVDLDVTDLVAGLSGPSSPTTKCPTGTVTVPVAGCLPATGGSTVPPLTTPPLTVPKAPVPGTGGTLVGGVLGNGASYRTSSDYTLILLQGAAT